MLQKNPPFEYAQLPAAFFERVPDAAFERLKLVALNEALAESFGLDLSWLRGDEGLAFLAGNASAAPEGALAMAYAGHQFGHWSGLLGDGRARLVGEVLGADGWRNEIHLKGAGATPFSRRGDGRATLGSALREYVVSEAMLAFGVPTTRSLAIVATGEAVHRNDAEPGAVLARTARSHIRVGTFQYAAAYLDVNAVKALADFAIARLYPEAPADSAEKYRYFYRAVALCQARLIADWMALGFIHGVMNTDNMMVSGETIDYGPCAFMDEFHPAKVFSSIDRHGRYSWNSQPEIAHWNLVRLAEAMLPLLGDNQSAQEIFVQRALDEFGAEFRRAFNLSFAEKFGMAPDNDATESALPALFGGMTEGRCDFTRLFTALTRHAAGETDTIILDEFSDRGVGARFIEVWRSVAGAPAEEGRLDAMRRRNPVIIPRNHRIEQAIADANLGDFAAFNRLFGALKAPFSGDAEFADLEAAPLDEEVVRQTFCGT